MGKGLFRTRVQVHSRPLFKTLLSSLGSPPRLTPAGSGPSKLGRLPHPRPSCCWLGAAVYSSDPFNYMQLNYTERLIKRTPFPALFCFVRQQKQDDIKNLFLKVT